jgi:hypothetical protein
MSIFTEDLAIDQAADFSYTTFPYCVNGEIQDLTGVTCRLYIFKHSYDAAPMLALTSSPNANGSVVSNGTLGTVTWIITNPATAALLNRIGPLQYNLFIDRSGALLSVELTSGGDSYTTAPQVSFATGGGSGTTVTPTVVGGQVTAITVTGGGTGYISAPTVVISGGGGTGATATATIAAGAVTAVTMTNIGEGYTGSPSVSFVPGTGFDAAATATINSSGSASGVVISDEGYGYTTAPAVVFSSGDAAATAIVSSATITEALQSGRLFLNAGFQ